MIKVNPFFANSVAIARPKPEVAPVIIIVLVILKNWCTKVDRNK